MFRLLRQLELTFLIVLCTQPVLAQGLDGRYRPVGPRGETWDCRRIGKDGGAIAFANRTFIGIGSRCSLRNPQKLRGMDAALFDMTCSGGAAIKTRRIIIMGTPNGIAMIENGGEVSYFARCE